MRLETNRLIIRDMSQNDLHFVHKYLKDEETMLFFVEGIYSIEKVKEVIENNSKRKELFSVIIKDTQELIGHLSFVKWDMKDTYEIGWVFNKLFYNKGYATEASKALLHHAFKELNVHRVVATCQPENTPSIKIMEKLNMRLEGNNKKCIYFKDNIWWDELFYAIIDEEYKG